MTISCKRGRSLQPGGAGRPSIGVDAGPLRERPAARSWFDASGRRWRANTSAVTGSTEFPTPKGPSYVPLDGRAGHRCHARAGRRRLWRRRRDDRITDRIQARPVAQIDALSGQKTEVKLDAGFVEALGTLKLTRRLSATARSRRKASRASRSPEAT